MKMMNQRRTLLIRPIHISAILCEVDGTETTVRLSLNEMMTDESALVG